MAPRLDVNPLQRLTDGELAMRFRAGDPEAVVILLERYRRFAHAKASGYLLAGADRQDVEQECMIGLYKAVRDFSPEREASFVSFAELCITRQVITAVKNATRHKHQPLNRYVSISGSPGGDDGERSVDALLGDHSAPDPADEVVSNARIDSVRRVAAEVLTDLEVDVLRLYLAGRSYDEIADDLGRELKSIDNALQRIKRKLERRLQDDASRDLLAA